MMLRVEKLRKKMQEENLDSFLVTSPYNLRYLTNFTGTTGLAVITLEKAFFITDFRYTEQAAAQAQGFEIIKNVGPIFDEVANLVRKEELHSLAFEETTVSFLEYSVLEEIIDAELVPVSQMIEELREVKDEEEIAIIEKACHIADMCQIIPSFFMPEDLPEGRENIKYFNLASWMAKNIKYEKKGLPFIPMCLLKSEVQSHC